MQRGLAALDRIEEFVGEEEEKILGRKPEKMPMFQDRIWFDHIKFGYDKELILKNFNLEIRHTQKIGIVGYSGQGKTTIIDLLLRFFPLIGGHIRLDGHDINNLSLAGYRSLFGLVGQLPALFYGTLRDNILLGAKRDDDRLKRLMSVVQLSPGFLEKRVGDRGTQLSGGEGQRVAIARALYRDPSILLLDEPTSELDAKNEAEVVKALLESMKNRTVIMISHNVHLLRQVDRIIVLNEGEIVEQGTYENLREKSKIFKTLINSF